MSKYLFILMDSNNSLLTNLGYFKRVLYIFSSMFLPQELVILYERKLLTTEEKMIFLINFTGFSNLSN